ncbi:MAG: TatD family hydrolase [Ectothiorhodospiraceae bacterium]|jgi:TatD DNase family protein
MDRSIMPETPKLVEIGVNLTHKRFNRDRDEVIERALDAGIEFMVLTGVDEAGSAASLELARQHSQIMSATAGVHPHHATDWSGDTLRAIRDLAADPLVVAVGETGLDFNRDFSPRPVQEKAFTAQLELAAELGLPVFLHQRDAHERFLAILKEYRDALPAAVVHCFTAGRDELWPYLDLDLYVGVTGWICDERRGAALRECVEDIPAERLLVETDAPFLTPRDLEPKPKGGRNEPAFLPHIVAAVARCRRTDAAQLAAATTANARRFFNR